MTPYLPLLWDIFISKSLLSCCHAGTSLPKKSHLQASLLPRSQLANRKGSRNVYLSRGVTLLQKTIGRRCSSCGCSSSIMTPIIASPARKPQEPGAQSSYSSSSLTSCCCCRGGSFAAVTAADAIGKGMIDGRWIEIQARNGIVRCKMARAADVEGRNGRVGCEHQGLDFGMLGRCWHGSDGVAEELIHVFESEVGGFGVEEVDCGDVSLANCSLRRSEE